VLVIGHRNMLAFAKDVKAGALEGSHEAFMRELGSLVIR
jgi:hypothetical protein